MLRLIEKGLKENSPSLNYTVIQYTAAFVPYRYAHRYSKSYSQMNDPISQKVSYSQSLSEYPV